MARKIPFMSITPISAVAPSESPDIFWTPIQELQTPTAELGHTTVRRNAMLYVGRWVPNSTYRQYITLPCVRTTFWRILVMP